MTASVRAHGERERAATRAKKKVPTKSGSGGGVGVRSFALHASARWRARSLVHVSRCPFCRVCALSSVDERRLLVGASFRLTLAVVASQKAHDDDDDADADYDDASRCCRHRCWRWSPRTRKRFLFLFLPFLLLAAFVHHSNVRSQQSNRATE